MTPSPDTREMYSEIGALVGAIAQAFAISEADTIAALDANQMTMEMTRDSNDNPFIAVRWKDQSARVYQGAIKRPPGKRPPGA